MMFNHPVWLLLLPLALLPLFADTQRTEGHPALLDLEYDLLSAILQLLLRVAGVLAIAGLIFGLAGLARPEYVIERTGQGSDIVLLIDRSSSMDNTFAGQQPDGTQESKSAAAKRILRNFIERREHDRFGIVGFSTAPMHVMPMTDHKDIILAAIDSIDRPGLAFTDVGRGLLMALLMQSRNPTGASRAIILVSDGAAVIGRRLQERLRAEFARHQINLYWLYLRSAGSKGMFEVPASNEEDTPQVLPERHLNKFFEGLKIPYRAFEAESPEAVAHAVNEIGKLEQKPVIYAERRPQHDLSRYAYIVALLGLAVLLAAKAAERSISSYAGRANAA
ncbi:MAG: VWA domain-containing protein [Hyphomicrobium sp.]|nr:VWA domain-containing protein [Hyphomicrobium sp.]